MRTRHTSSFSLGGPKWIVYFGVSLLASLYVLQRLWASHAQMELLTQLYSKSLSEAEHNGHNLGGSTSTNNQHNNCEEKAIFYNIRPMHEGDIKPLEGLKAPETIQSIETHSDIAQVSMIAGGFVSGWACHRVANASTKGNPVKMAMSIDGTIVAEIDAHESEKTGNIDIVKACHAQEMSIDDRSNMVYSFNHSLPLLVEGMHTLRMYVKQFDGSYTEAYHSPVQYEESTIEPSAREALKRKDAIITMRNNQLTQIWDELKTQLPWKRAEREFSEQERDAEGDAVDVNRLMAVILVHSKPQDTDNRAAVRQTWGAPLRHGGSKIAYKFIINKRFAGVHAGSLVQESVEHDDIILLEPDVVADSTAFDVLLGLAKIITSLDANFYFVTWDYMIIIPSRLQSLLKSMVSQGNLYLGCMKSGEVVMDESKMWYEKDHWKFGDPIKDRLQYPRHASGEFYGFSRSVARYLARNKQVLGIYSNEDTTVGTWMLGLQIQYKDEGKMCCDASTCDFGRKYCVAYHSACKGDGCLGKQGMPKAYASCGKES